MTDTGEMLRSLHADVTDNGFRLAPTGRRNLTVAHVHQAGGRRWMGATERQIDAARETIADAIREKR